MNELLARGKTLSSEIEIVTQQVNVLSDYSKTLNGKDTTAEQLGNFLDVYASRQAKLDEKKSKLQADLEGVLKEVQKKSASFNIDDESVLKRGVRITVVVLAEGAGPAELSLTYLVSNASWTPQYDLRANVAPGAKSDSTVTVHYRASISQQTGENWTGVELTLSTASPMLGTTIPSLGPMWIAEKPLPQIQRAMVKSAAPRLARMRRRETLGSSTNDEESEMDRGMSFPQAAVSYMLSSSAPPQPAAPLRISASMATEGAVSATFSIPGLSTIPSDSDTSQQTHRVSVAELSFSNVDLEWITVPKDTASAFLRCKVKNTSKYLLLPGQANVFLNGNFVSKSRIPHVSPQESFPCSLGVDPAIRVTCHPQTKKTRSSGGSVLSSLSAKVTTTLYEQVVSIKNTRLSRVHRLLLKEQIPVSRDSRFKVNLLEPRSLVFATAKGGRNEAVTVSEAIKVQWASRNDEEDENPKVPREELTAESAQGLLEWIITIEPGSTVDVNLSWEVVAPLGVEWSLDN